MAGLVLAVSTALTLSLDRWAAVGEWLGAAGTVMAVVAALHIANREARMAQQRQQLEAEQQHARDIVSAQQRELEAACLVIVVAEYVDESQFSGNISPDDAPDVDVRITNHGSEPILFPRLELLPHPLAGESHWTVWVEPTGLNEGWGPKASLGPGEVESFYADVTYEPKVPNRWEHSLQPVIGFTDKAGRRWRRHGSKLPYRVQSGDVEPIGGDHWYRAPHQ
jgi:hypothetical protein